MKEFKGSILFTSHDMQIVNTVANRIVEISSKGCVDKIMTYEEYLENNTVQEQVAAIY
jgi:ATPase subunit of ABC transporter with duplicated ATPase domains